MLDEVFNMPKEAIRPIRPFVVLYYGTMITGIIYTLLDTTPDKASIFLGAICTMLLVGAIVITIHKVPRGTIGFDGIFWYKPGYHSFPKDKIKKFPLTGYVDLDFVSWDVRVYYDLIPEEVMSLGGNPKERLKKAMSSIDCSHLEQIKAPEGIDPSHLRVAIRLK